MGETRRQDGGYGEARAGSRAPVVRRAGGAIYYSWGAAHDAEQAANYPPEVEGLIPRVRGAFARYALEGRRVYIPEPVTVKLEETHGQ